MMRALLSVSDKTGLVPFATALVDGWAGSWCPRAARPGPGGRRPAGHRDFRRHRVPGDDGRPGQDAASEGARRHSGAAPSRRTTWTRCGRTASRPIDLVVVNLYPFAKAAARADIAFDDLIEEIDIGGPSLVRAAAKNFRDVLVVVDPADYDGVLDALGSADGPSLLVALRSRAARHRAHGGLRPDDRVDAVRDSRGRSAAEPFVRDRRRRVAAGSLDARAREDPRSAVRRESASARRVVSRAIAAGLAAPSCTRARNCRSRTCSISTPRRASRSSSTSRRRW